MQEPVSYTHLTMAKNAHLVLDERATIEVRIRERASFTEIGRELGKDPSTISKEVRLHSQTVRKDSFNPCSKRSTCCLLYTSQAPARHRPWSPGAGGCQKGPNGSRRKSKCFWPSCRLQVCIDVYKRQGFHVAAVCVMVIQLSFQNDKLDLFELSCFLQQ